MGRLRSYASPHIFKNSASSKISTLNSCALVSLEPASAPASTKSVFLLTLPPAVSCYGDHCARKNWQPAMASTVKLVEVPARVLLWTVNQLIRSVEAQIV